MGGGFYMRLSLDRFEQGGSMRGDVPGKEAIRFHPTSKAAGCKCFSMKKRRVWRPFARSDGLP
ncbi:hypothetical protein ASE49_01690 [Novosphingobium sp. Leaf2]|nr:hypothetical protein ASE49_01690 [Novosphingobium sp. Leaf2]